MRRMLLSLLALTFLSACAHRPFIGSYSGNNAYLEQYERNRQFIQEENEHNQILNQMRWNQAQQQNQRIIDRLWRQQ